MLAQVRAAPRPHLPLAGMGWPCRQVSELLFMELILGVEGQPETGTYVRENRSAGPLSKPIM